MNLVLTHSVCPCKNYGLKCSNIILLFLFFQASQHTKQKKNCLDQPNTLYNIIAQTLAALTVLPVYIANAWLPCTNIGKCHNTGVNQCKCTCAYGKWLSQQHVFIDIFNSKVSIKNLPSSFFCTNIVLCAHIKIMLSSVPRSPNHFFLLSV